MLVGIYFKALMKAPGVAIMALIAVDHALTLANTEDDMTDKLEIYQCLSDRYSCCPNGGYIYVQNGVATDDQENQMAIDIDKMKTLDDFRLVDEDTENVPPLKSEELFDGKGVEKVGQNIIVPKDSKHGFCVLTEIGETFETREAAEDFAIEQGESAYIAKIRSKVVVRKQIDLIPIK
jgi:hypothetical protein